MSSGGGDSNPIHGTEDTGQPIHELLAQELETSHDFIARVRRRIHRRSSAAQFASFSWHLPKIVLLEMSGLLKHLLVSIGEHKDSRGHER